MTIPRVFGPFQRLVERSRPAFFSQQEWWFHLCLAIVSLPIGNYIFFGPAYLTDFTLFVVSSFSGFLLYSISIAILTLVVRRIIDYYPTSRQTIQRTAAMTIILSVIAMILEVVELFIFSYIPLFQLSFDWQNIWPMWVIIVVFVCIFSIVLNLLYAYKHWKAEQLEVESLKRRTLQQQFDTLKQQVNPHFLFNSLSSISALVGEDPVQAERFVDNLAKVYRYMLQANNRLYVPLTDELTFIGTYATLLKVRYGPSISIVLPPSPTDLPGYLLPLSLQILLDNALKHNRMSPDQPLTIQISLVGETGVQVRNSLQRKTRLLNIDQQSLTNLIIRYRSLTDTTISVVEDETDFSVTVPLLSAVSPFTAQQDA